MKFFKFFKLQEQWKLLKSAIEYEVLRIRIKALSKNILYMELFNNTAFDFKCQWFVIGQECLKYVPEIKNCSL